MAARSSVLAWRIPWTEEPGGPQSTGSRSRTLMCTHAHTSVTVAVVAAPAGRPPQDGKPWSPRGWAFSVSVLSCVLPSLGWFSESEVLAKAGTVGLGVQ